jgi:hypothetical protein
MAEQLGGCAERCPAHHQPVANVCRKSWQVKSVILAVSSAKAVAGAFLPAEAPTTLQPQSDDLAPFLATADIVGLHDDASRHLRSTLLPTVSNGFKVRFRKTSPK